MNKTVFTFSILVLLVGIPFFFAVSIPAEPPEAPSGEAFSAAQEDTLPAPLLDVIRTPSSVGEVVFPHQEHVEDFEIDCKTCHHETNAAILDIPHEAYFEDFWIDCTLCHRETGLASLEAQACSNCHPDRPGEIADETLSAKVVIHKNCWECHEVGTGAAASERCKDCHTGPRIPSRPFGPSPVKPHSTEARVWIEGIF